MKPFTAVAIVAGLVPALGLACKARAPSSPAPNAAFVNSRPQSPNPRLISPIAILADPAKFHGRILGVQAFFSHTRAGWVLAPDLTSLSQDMGVNWINLDLTKCDEADKLLAVGNPGMCIVVGTVDAYDYGPNEDAPLACTFRATKCMGIKLRPEN